MTGAYMNAIDVCLDTPGERPLIRDLQLRLADEHVAVVGRNGVGKSSLLEVLAGEVAPTSGQVSCRGSRGYVPQHPVSDAKNSPGELRKHLLEAARAQQPDFLLLDEPSQDLDEDSITWLVGWLKNWNRGLIVVSHDRRVLRLFTRFFVVEERGCRLFRGSFDDLLLDFERRTESANREYASELYRLMAKEVHNARIRSRRARKKAGGRVRELKRCPARACLNAKRGYAQKYQAKREGVRLQRIARARELARGARRALSVELPLQLGVPTLKQPETEPLIQLQGVGARTLFSDLSLSLTRQRLGIVGPNGSGKTTLLQIMVGDRVPETGSARRTWQRIGYIAQHAENWRSSESLVSRLFALSDATTPDDVVQQLSGHRFPLALAERPLESLSPGERVRAALICLFQKQPSVEMLVLDEPTDQLDLFGIEALERVLEAWQGGLVVVSHDWEFLERIRIDQYVDMSRDDGSWTTPCR